MSKSEAPDELITLQWTIGHIVRGIEQHKLPLVGENRTQSLGGWEDNERLDLGRVGGQKVNIIMRNS